MKKNTNETSTSLVPAVLGDFALMRQELATVKRVLDANLGGRQLSLADLDLVKVGRGGSTHFLMNGPDGETSAPTITGVIVAYQPIRRYWSTPPDESGGGREPDCVSVDGRTGVGVPGGTCLLCPESEWRDGERPRCGERRLVYVLQAADVIPVVLDAPSSSIRSLDKYLLQLVRVGAEYHAVMTELRLERVKSDGGFAFARVAPRLTARLGGEEAARTAAYAKFFGALLAGTDTRASAGALPPTAAPAADLAPAPGGAPGVPDVPDVDEPPVPEADDETPHPDDPDWTTLDD